MKGQPTSSTLDRRINIQTPVETTTGTGAKVVTWENWKSDVPASKAYSNAGQENFTDGKLITEGALTFMTRYLTKSEGVKVPNAKMRIIDLLTEEIFEIEYVAEVGRRVGWAFTIKHKK